MEFFYHPWYMAAGGLLISSPIIIHQDDAKEMVSDHARQFAAMLGRTLHTRSLTPWRCTDGMS